MIDLKNNKGIIFGATGFIGRQVALEMSKRKVKLILHGKTKKNWKNYMMKFKINTISSKFYYQEISKKKAFLIHS